MPASASLLEVSWPAAASMSDVAAYEVAVTNDTSVAALEWTPMGLLHSLTLSRDAIADGSTYFAVRATSFAGVSAQSPWSRGVYAVNTPPTLGYAALRPAAGATGAYITDATSLSAHFGNFTFAGSAVPPTSGASSAATS